MKALAFLSLISVLIISSCATLKDSVKIGMSGNNSIDHVPHVIDSLADTHIFELQMNYKSDEFSGLLLMKKYGKENYRIVLTSHFGLTVFDMEVNKREYIVHYCIQPLNNKRALYLLRNDFSMLLKPDFFSNIRYKLDSNKRLIALERKGSITKTVMYFINYKGLWPTEIRLEHPFLKLFIILKTLPDAIASPI